MEARFLETAALITNPLVIGTLLLAAMILITLGGIGVRTRAQFFEPIRLIPTILGCMALSIAGINVYISASAADPSSYRFAGDCINQHLEQEKGEVTYWELGAAIRSCRS